MFNQHQKINRYQVVLTTPQYNRLVQNHRTRTENAVPVVKFFDPFGASTWLLTELDPESGDAFGLCDLGQGFPEMGYVSLQEMIDIGRIERDLHFRGDKSLMAYADEANAKGRIIA